MKVIVDYDKYTELLNLTARLTGYYSYCDSPDGKKLADDVWIKVREATAEMKFFFDEDK